MDDQNPNSVRGNLGRELTSRDKGGRGCRSARRGKTATKDKTTRKKESIVVGSESGKSSLEKSEGADLRGGKKILNGAASKQQLNQILARAPIKEVKR